MNKADVKAYFEKQGVVNDYSDAVDSVGLWNSESKILSDIFPNKNANIIELGCGAGRIAIGLHKLGFSNILATDIAADMVSQAQKNAKTAKCPFKFEFADATNLQFDDNSFDGAIFGFNGLMQIPTRAQRKIAMQEIFRIIKPNTPFFFTTHDQNTPGREWFWKREKRLWSLGEQEKELREFGDRYYETTFGFLFIHIPTREEIFEDMFSLGFEHIFDNFRSEISEEPEAVHKFSDECRLWVFRKPA